ncbi:MAG: SPOR domain-containing protein [candidate division Zixibacteria bacterium]|nr:SPOR domain-containing protein [Candidatus Tariuqbacter arcticus]
MSFPIPISILIAAVLLIASELDRKFFPEEPPALVAPDTAAAVLPADTIIAEAALPPPVPIAPIEEQAETLGFRVQIFSSENQASAQALRERLKFILPYDIHISYKDDNWKVRVGDFTDKEPAQRFCDELKAGEFPDAWVVQCPMNRFVDGFRIQLASMRTHNSAASYARLIEKEISLPVYLVKADNAWKIRVGDFINENNAISLRDELIAMGYSDAWITPDKVKP